MGGGGCGVAKLWVRHNAPAGPKAGPVLQRYFCAASVPILTFMFLDAI
jgi:hypothetical protein